MIVVMAALGLYQSEHPESFVSILNRTIIAFAAGSALMSVVFYLFPETYIGRGVFAYTATIAFCSLLIVRTVFFRWTAFGVLKKRVLILGAGEQARGILELVSRNGHKDAIDVVGVHPLTTADVAVTGTRILPITMSVSEAAHQYGVHEIIIAMREQRGGALPVSQLLDCKLRGVQITDLQTFFERELGQIRLDSLKASWLVFGEGCRQGLLRETVKRLFDVLVSGAAAARHAAGHRDHRVPDQHRGPRPDLLSPGTRRPGRPRVRDPQVPQHATRCRARRQAEVGEERTTTASRASAASSAARGSTSCRRSSTCCAAR